MESKIKEITKEFHLSFLILNSTFLIKIMYHHVIINTKWEDDTELKEAPSYIHSKE